jgi:glycosyltransferase involved in cell wall biosynthesis
VTEPLVCAIMLTRDRPEMARRAVESFRAQTYERKKLLIVNSGPGPVLEESETCEAAQEPCFIGIDVLTIGALRNHGCKYASHHYTTGETCPEVFIHWDDDDWSHPNRIAEQVGLLQASNADAVGYRELLFWRTGVIRQVGKGSLELDERVIGEGPVYGPVGEAWLHTKRHALPFAFGTSLCYWRKTWEAKPFPDLPKNPHGSGEDYEWLKGLKLESVSALRKPCCGHPLHEPPCAPRMIASIHPGNSSGGYDLEYLLAHGNQEWKRAPEFDDYCRERMAL